MQVASLKQDLQLLHHDNTLLRNALARAQQESTEYALCTRSTPQNSTAVKSTEHQHTDTALSMSKEASQLAEQLQAELDACKHKIAQESDEKQVHFNCLDLHARGRQGSYAFVQALAPSCGALFSTFRGVC